MIKDLEGINIGGNNINNIRFADDTTLLAFSEKELQILIDKLAEASEGKGLKINTRKTFTMVVTKHKEVPKCRILLNGREIEQVSQFKYLGSIITSDGRSDKDIRTRIGMAKSAFMEMKQILTSKKISKETRLRILKCYVWSVLLYGAETWTISKDMKKKLEAAEMWFYRRMLKVPWTDKRTNKEILQMMEEEQTLLDTIKLRQLKFFGHSMRKNGLENLAVTGMVMGKRSRGKQRSKYTDRLREGLEIDTNIELLRKTRDRETWRSMVADASMHGT